MNENKLAFLAGFVSFQLNEPEPILNHTEYGNSDEEVERYWFDHWFYNGYNYGVNSYMEMMNNGETVKLANMYLREESMYGMGA